MPAVKDLLKREEEIFSDTNDGEGYIVFSKFKDDDCFFEYEKPTYGQARREVLGYSTLKNSQAAYAKAKNGQIICKWNKSDNYFVEFSQELKEISKQLTNKDMAGHLLYHKTRLTKEEENILMEAVLVGGNTTHEQNHKGCIYLQEKELIQYSFSERKWIVL